MRRMWRWIICLISSILCRRPHISAHICDFVQAVALSHVRLVRSVRELFSKSQLCTNLCGRTNYVKRRAFAVRSPRQNTHAFDTSEAWVFCRGCQIRNPLEDSTDKRFYSLVEYTPFRLVGIERTRHFALRFRYFGSVGILSR